MSDSSTIFSGSSRYAADFQQVIQRAVNIASLPLRQIQQQQTKLSAEAEALSTLSGKFDSLRGALVGLDQGRERFLEVNSTDSGVARLSVETGASVSSFSLEVITPGAFSSAMNRTGLPVVVDPASDSITAATELTLSVNGVTCTVRPSAGTLNALAQAVNAANAGVNATIINLGSPGSPNYQLAIRAAKLGSVTISLTDPSGELLTPLATGTMAQYRLNGMPAEAIQSDSRSVILAAGVRAELSGAGTTEIEVSASSTAWKDSLAALVTAYNAAVDETDKHRGKQGGALSGQAIPLSISSALRQLLGFQGSGAIQQLADLGIAVNQYGKLEFDTDVFDTLISSRPGDVAAFLGTEEGDGFLGSAVGILDSLNGLQGGLLTTAREGVQQQLSEQDSRVSSETDRITRLQQSLQEQMAAADAIVAMLEQQVLLIKGMFQSMQNSNGQN
jgi:flagellar hook-associated protein 2